jgi:hypothetical protein
VSVTSAAVLATTAACEVGSSTAPPPSIVDSSSDSSRRPRNSSPRRDDTGWRSVVGAAGDIVNDVNVADQNGPRRPAAPNLVLVLERQPVSRPKEEG